MPAHRSRRITVLAAAAAVVVPLAAVPAAQGATGRAAAHPAPAELDRAAPVTDPASLVDPLVGTANAGNTYPGAVAPFGMISLSPQQTRYYGPADGTGTVRSASPSGYQYGADTISGFGLTHLSGAGCNGASGDVPIMPITREVTVSPTVPDGSAATTYASTFSHQNETAGPGFYQVLLDSGVTVSLAATQRTGAARFTFPDGEPAGLLIRGSDSIAGSSDATVSIDPGERSVTGSVTSGNFCGPYTGDGILQRSYYTLQYRIVFDQPFRAVGTWHDEQVSPGSTTASGGTGYHGGRNPDGSAADGYAPAGKGSGGYLMFEHGSTVNARIAISYVSADGATANLEAENPAGTTLEQVRAQTTEAWNAELGAITVSGGTETAQRAFYTALYHALLHPNLASDVDGRYTGFDGEAHQLADGQQAQYATFSGWDVYRSQVQLVTLLNPQRGSDIAASLLHQAEQNGGVWDRWTHNSGGTHVMVGDPSAVALAGIVAFGGTDFDVQRSFDSLAQAARVPTEQDYSRAGWNVAVIGQRPSLDQFLEHGYYPEGCNAWGCPNETIEMAAADYGLATLARYLGDQDAYHEFVTRSQSWQRQFNPDATAGGGYIAARAATGAWISGFDPASSSGFVEGTGAQYVWMVQHNPAGLFDAMGGRDVAIDRLNHLFTDSEGNWTLIGPWNGNVHANMDNEPSIATPWLYNYAGAPWKTQQTVRATIDQLWLQTKDGIPGGPDGIPGNDDLGEMSSWLVFAAMGLYPQNPSRAELTMAAPLFDAVTVRRANGVRLQINAPGAPEAPYIDAVRVNHRITPNTYLPASVIAEDTTVDITVSGDPNTRRGIHAVNAPPSDRTGELAYTATLSAPQTTAVPGGLSKEVTLDLYRLGRQGPRQVAYTVAGDDDLTPITPTGTVELSSTQRRASVPIVLRAAADAEPGSHQVQIDYAVDGQQLGSMQLQVRISEQASTVLGTSFEPGQQQPVPNTRLSMSGFAEYCCGIGGTESKAQGGFGNTGSWAVIYSARAVQPGNHAANVLLDPEGSDAVVHTGDLLSYAVHPQATGGPFGGWVQNLSQYVSVDLLFADGTRLSDTGVIASNDARLDPVAQGEVLDPDTWTTVTATVPQQADGKVIDKVLLRYGTGGLIATDGEQDGYLRGWIDDLTLTHPLPPITVTASDGIAAVAGTSVTAELATMTGGNGHRPDDFSAVVDWGDGTDPYAAQVEAAGDGRYTVVGAHTWVEAGTYPVTITVSDLDGVRASDSTTATVTEASARALPRIRVAGPADTGGLVSTRRGGSVTVHGSGFTPEETVRLAVDAPGATPVTATADADGTVTASLPVPSDTAGYDTITAFGVISARTAIAGLHASG